MEMRVRAIIVFKTDGLDEPAIKSELEKDVSVLDVTDDNMSYVDDENKTITEPVRLFYLDGTLGQITKLKLKWNCFTTPQSPWVFYPR